MCFVDQEPYAFSGTSPGKSGPAGQLIACLRPVSETYRGCYRPVGPAYADLLIGQYDCVDRIILNAYVPLACSCGGFRTWWRNLQGNDDTLDNAYLMRMAGRFSPCARARVKKENIAVIDCAAGERKHNMADEHLPSDLKQTEIFLVLVNRTPALIWDVRCYGDGGINVRRKIPMPCVNHYSFHIWDAEWGHVAIRMCGQPPFSAMIMLNGHEYVYRRRGLGSRLQIG